MSSDFSMVSNGGRFELDSAWTLSYLAPENGALQTVPARVPGNVLGDLKRAGKIPDPYFGRNSADLRPYEFVDWEYHTTFTAPQIPSGARLFLVFDGIDTAADILVNGVAVGRAENMFLPHRFELSAALLHNGANELSVRIESAINYARRFPIPSWCHCGQYCYAGLVVRRPRHSYGWDIAPRLISGGLWRRAYLELVPDERWTDLYLATTDLTPNYCRLGLNWNFTTPNKSLLAYEGRIRMVCGDRSYEKRFPLYFTTGTTWLEPENPRIWNPAGSGEPNLYDVTLELLRDGVAVDTRCWRTGIRTVKLLHSETLAPDGAGTFVFQVNGRDIFVKGADWVPTDALHGENPERVRQALELFSDLGCNLVRCWGGGVYENDEFFDYCDKHGLLVWQDFMFALETAPQNAEFLERVRSEAETIIRKLRNHASLALWCGDNECDLLSFDPLNQRMKPEDNLVSRSVLPRAVMNFDPMRDYLPSSPYISPEVKRLKAFPRMPEQHLWGARASWKSPYYLHSMAIFASEIGYNGLPSCASLKQFLPEAELEHWKSSPSWLCHASQPLDESNGPNSYRIALTERQSEEFWGGRITELADFVEKSQIAQAEALKTFIESFRADKGKKTGIVWWNLLDCWPQCSDAVVDYYFRRKLAYDYIRNAQRPLLFLLRGPEDWNLRLSVSNDAPTSASGRYRVSDLMSGEVFASGEYRVGGEAVLELPPIPYRQDVQSMLLIEWDDNGKCDRNHYLTGNPPFRLEQYRAFLDRLDNGLLQRLDAAVGR